MADFLQIATRYARAVRAERISPVEYAENTLAMSVLYDLDDETAREVANSVPDEVREALENEISKVLAPAYELPKLHFGGGQPTETELEIIRSQRTQRIKSCARLLQRELAGRE